MEEKKGFKIDLSSSMVEKAVDMAKNFLDKLIIPSIEETGLLLKDQVTYFKFKNQVRILNKAREYCEKNNITTKSIPLKLLCPLLENASLEENEFLQDRWSILLGNLIDSEQNIENHVFPYLLSQVSSSEFKYVEDFVNEYSMQKRNIEIELSEHINTTKHIKTDLENQMAIVNGKIVLLKEVDEENKHLGKIEELRKKLQEYSEKDYEISRKTSILTQKSNLPPLMNIDGLKGFEVVNLIRLGIIKEIRIVKGRTDRSDRYRVKVGHMGKSITSISNTTENHVTELGILLIKSCNSKTVGYN